MNKKRPVLVHASATVALVATVSIGVWAVAALRPAPARAIPMLADRTGASCELCHTVFPGMTNYGMMVMMSNFSMTPYHAGTPTGFTSLVFEQQYVSNPDGDPAPPKFHTDNLGFLSGGFLGQNFTYYVEQHVIDGGFIGGTDQMWISYNQLFGGTGALQFGKFHTPFPFMPAHRITLGPYATTSATQGENDFNEDDSHWGVTLSQMSGTSMFGISMLGGNDLIGPGAFQLAGDHSHSVDLTMMTMSDNPLNYGVGVIRGEAPVDDGFDSFSRSALYLQFIPAANRRLQFQAVAQVGSDADPFGNGSGGTHTRGGFLEAQYQLQGGNWSVLRWDVQNGDSPVAGATLEFIHQLTPNSRVTAEGRKLTTGSQFGVAYEWAGPWSRHHLLATPTLGEMKGMGGMSMAGMAGMSMSNSSPLVATLRGGDALHGHALFDGQRCAQCHGVGGSGGGGAPALIGAAKTLEPEQIYDYIKNPRPPMPDFHLSDHDIADLVAYVDSLTPGHTVVADLDAEHPGSSMAGMSMSGGSMSGMSMAQAPAVYPPDQAAQDNGPHGLFPGVELGDPDVGAKLFSADCVSCHGAGGSGGFGPRLIGLADQVTPSFFAWRIKDPTSPMPKLPLTDAQIADLAAYLETLGASSGTVGSTAPHNEAHR
jgi:mono/diheme cytochrome c family protein